MTNFLWFMLGALMIEFWPLLDKVVELGLTKLEYYKGIITFKITKLQQKINEIGEEKCEEATNLIGFQLPDESALDEEQD